VSAVALPVVLNAWILATTAAGLHQVADAPRRPIAIVLGAKVHADGRPTRILADRLDAALSLYRAGQVASILVSGGRDIRRRYDEVEPMRQYLLARGVPAIAISSDPHGARTFDSMWRARHVLGVEAALVVTNAFHLPRALWLARQVGIDAEAVVAPATVEYTRRSRVLNELREVGARTLAVLDVLVGAAPGTENIGGAVIR
jgi:vancomycin permeability regulator SanA